MSVISIPEIVKVYLTTALSGAGISVPGGIVVGPVQDADQQAGCISIVEAGTQNPELYAPIAHQRIQVRVITPDPAATDLLARKVYPYLHHIGRNAVTQADGGTYLMHQCNVIAGPSMHFNTQESWESLMFLSVMVGTQAIS